MTSMKAIILVAYIAAVAVGTFLRRPSDIAFPGLAFFTAFVVLPCLTSWLVIGCFGRASWKMACVALLAALAVFCLTWLLQLSAVAQYALSQSSSQVEGLISNFYVFTNHIFPCGLGVAGFSLFVAIVLNRRGAQDVPA